MLNKSASIFCEIGFDDIIGLRKETRFDSLNMLFPLPDYHRPPLNGRDLIVTAVSVGKRDGDVYTEMIKRYENRNA